MQGYYRIIFYILSALLIISSLVIAMPGALFGLGKTASSKLPQLPAGEYRLGIAETKFVQGIQLTFVGVARDTRCLSGEDCVSPGNAEILLKVTSGGSAESFRLSTDDSVPVGNLTATIVSLDPPSLGTNRMLVLRVIEKNINQ